MTTINRELGAPPPRAIVKTQLVVNLARCLGAEPRNGGFSGAEPVAIADATAQWEDAARRD
jgi:hypothetical protein